MGRGCLAFVPAARRAAGTAALAVLLVLAPWRFGMLDYWNMLFLNAAQYSFKVLLPLLLFALLLARRPRAGDWLLAALCLAGIGLTGLSSGVYTAACGLAPVLLWFFWRCWRQACRPSAFQGVCAGGAVLATGAGLWANAAFGAAAKGDSMTLVGAADFVTNAANCLVGFWRLFGGIPDGKTPVEALSLAGVTTLLRQVWRRRSSGRRCGPCAGCAAGAGVCRTGPAAWYGCSAGTWPCCC